MSSPAPLGLAASYRALREGAVACAVECDVVRASGPDALSYLQTQCSQDLATLAVGESVESLLLAPQGRVEAYVRVARVEEQVALVVVAAGYGDAVRERLSRFRLRVKVDLEVARWPMLALRGPKSLELSGEEVGACVTGGAALAVRWPGLAGLDLVAPDVRRPAEVPLGDGRALEAARIEAGQPVMGREITERTIPEEAGVVRRAVSFAKGCYPGQELVARIDARGRNVPRRLRGLLVAGDEHSLSAPVQAQAPDAHPGEALLLDGRQVGEVTSAAWSPGLGATVALAYVRREVTPPVAVLLGGPPTGAAGSGGRRAEVAELPMGA